MSITTIDVRAFEVAYPVSAKVGLTTLAESDDVQLAYVSRGFTAVSALHPTHGRLLILVSSTEPSLVFGSPGLELGD